MKKYLSIVFVVTLFLSNQASAHCQIPCGIYGDNTRFDLMLEDTDTIGKAMIKAVDESVDEANRIRWVLNKEEHAQKIQDIVAQYFLAQRVKKPEGADDDSAEFKAYTNHLVHLHNITVLAMKAKQTTDVEVAQKLREAIESYKLYYGEHHSH